MTPVSETMRHPQATATSHDETTIPAATEPVFLRRSPSLLLTFSAATTAHARVNEGSSPDQRTLANETTRHPQPTAISRDGTTIPATSEPVSLLQSPSSLPVPSATTTTYNRVNKGFSSSQRTSQNETASQSRLAVTPLRETAHPNYLKCFGHTSGIRSQSLASVQGSGMLLVIITLLLVVAAASFVFAVVCWTFNAVIRVVTEAVLATTTTGRSLVLRLIFSAHTPSLKWSASREMAMQTGWRGPEPGLVLIVKVNFGRWEH